MTCWDPRLFCYEMQLEVKRHINYRCADFVEHGELPTTKFIYLQRGEEEGRLNEIQI